MICKRCGIDLGEYCIDCMEALLSEGIKELTKEREKRGKRGIIVYDNDPMYNAILARRDLDARKL